MIFKTSNSWNKLVFLVNGLVVYKIINNLLQCYLHPIKVKEKKKKQLEYANELLG